MKTTVAREACRGCGADVLHLVDVDTDEPIVIDAQRVDEGHIAVYAAAGHAVARRYGRPARTQPAWREHDCPSPTVAVPAAAPDPYEDKSPAAQQHGGWRH